ncbi:MAG: AAA family ATPase, partial [Bifidobacteriaceae bacterium]|nr:AAA family ATPase [Bifidobacteriaceae bacterium]
MTNIKAIADATATVSRLIGDLADRTDRGFLETVSHGNPADHAMEIALQRITEESHIISIWGERGSGKSTVLSSCFKQLKDDRRFALLPPLSPELFPTIADVVDIVLATIATHYESFLPPNSDEIAKAELRRSLALARQSAALDNLPVERLVAGMTTATDLERLVERSAGGTERLWLSLQRLVAEIVTADDKRRALIIGVDDA